VGRKRKERFTCMQGSAKNIQEACCRGKHIVKQNKVFGVVKRERTPPSEEALARERVKHKVSIGKETNWTLCMGGKTVERKLSGRGSYVASLMKEGMFLRLL